MFEKLISFDTAILAKEKGFNIPVLYFYDESEKGIYAYSNNCDYNDDSVWYDKDYLSAPTQSLLQQWLREIKSIDIEIYLINSANYGKMYGCLINYDSKTTRLDDKHKYTDILENSLQEALKLI